MQWFRYKKSSAHIVKPSWEESERVRRENSRSYDEQSRCSDTHTLLLSLLLFRYLLLKSTIYRKWKVKVWKMKDERFWLNCGANVQTCFFLVNFKNCSICIIFIDVVVDVEKKKVQVKGGRLLNIDWQWKRKQLFCCSTTRRSFTLKVIRQHLNLHNGTFL